MKEFMEFTKLEDRLIDTGFLAINIIILPIWIAIGTSDLASKISLFALVISMPMLVVDLLFIQMPHIKYSNKYYLTLVRFIRFTGWRFALFGITASIWHISWVIALVFVFIGLFCISVYFNVWKDTKQSLEEAEQKPL